MEDAHILGTIAGFSMAASELKNLKASVQTTSMDTACPEKCRYRSHHGRIFIMNQTKKEIKVECVSSLDQLHPDDNEALQIPQF